MPQFGQRRADVAAAASATAEEEEEEEEEEDEQEDPSTLEERNFETFADCFATSVLTALGPKEARAHGPSSTGKKSSSKRKTKVAAKAGRKSISTDAFPSASSSSPSLTTSTTKTSTTAALPSSSSSSPPPPSDDGVAANTAAITTVEPSFDADSDPPPPSAEDLTDFSTFLARVIFPSFPEAFRRLSYPSSSPPSSSSFSAPSVTATSAVAAEEVETLASDYYDLPLAASALDHICSRVPPEAIDSLVSYGLLPKESLYSTITTTNPSASSSSAAASLPRFLEPCLSAYVESLQDASQKRKQQQEREEGEEGREGRGDSTAGGCELCGRDWIPLTDHHLVPRSTHAKALKRGWHPPPRLAATARLCRACHSFVHARAGNEELARAYFTVELLAAREDVRRFAAWVGGVRWKKR